MDLECNIAVDMVTNDEATSFQQRLDEHRGWLRRLVRSRIADPNTADDVLQEVDTAAIESANRPRDPSQLGPWLCRIALRQCALVIRKQVRRQRLEKRLHENGDGHPAEPVDPIYWLIAEAVTNANATAKSNFVVSTDGILCLLALASVGGSFISVCSRLGTVRVLEVGVGDCSC